MGNILFRDFYFYSLFSLTKTLYNLVKTENYIRIVFTM